MGRNRWNLNKDERLQIKALIAGLGLLLLLILFTARFVVLRFQEGRIQDIHIPVVEHLTNVWIMEADENGILIFKDGVEEYYSYESTSDTGADVKNVVIEPSGEAVREQIADIVLTDGTVTEIQIKHEKVNGKILSVDDVSVEVENLGKLPLASDYKGYRIYNTLEMCNAKELAIGYDFADLVMENGEICGILMVKEDSMESIRVLIKSGDYASILHEQLIVSADSDFTVRYGSHDNLSQQHFTAGEEVKIDKGSDYFGGDRIIITPNVLTGKVILKNVNRNQGVPSYRGHIELLKTEDGIAVINQVLLEEYLYCVVPSEMPSSYPEEALKAQAICARTYAYGHMLKAGYPQYGAHVDDSTSYQVYNNILEQESTTTAVKETYGQLLFAGNDSLAGTYYYSTSCGMGSDANVWKTESAAAITYLSAKHINANAAEPISIEELQKEEVFAEFITSKNADDFEVTEGWYRWNYQVDKINGEQLCRILQKRYEVNPKLVLTYDGADFVEKPIEDFTEIKDIYIAKRGAGGVADELHIVTGDNTYKVITEHNIRYVLNDGESMVVRQDGSMVASPNILPSAFFIIKVSKEKDTVTGYTLTGGGFGHGVGMSQNGARHMAESGYTAEEILLFFYDACFIRNVYENAQ